MDRTAFAAGIRWRSATDIAEENRFGTLPNPDRAVAVTTHACTKCHATITEVLRADGTRTFDQFGVRSVWGEGLQHLRCPEGAPHVD